MKRTVPFEFFAPGQSVYFDTMRLVELEKLTGVSVMAMPAQTYHESIDFMLKACQVGLAHHYPNATLEDYATKIDLCLETGGSFYDIGTVLGHAIVASGVFGKEATERAMEMYTAKDTETPIASNSAEPGI